MIKKSENRFQKIRNEKTNCTIRLHSVQKFKSDFFLPEIYLKRENLQIQLVDITDANDCLTVRIIRDGGTSSKLEGKARFRDRTENSLRRDSR